MGSWNTKVSGNDIFQDIYQRFFQGYNDDGTPQLLTIEIMKEYEDVFNDPDDRNNGLFALAQALWETKSQDDAILDEVKEIIVREHDIAVWKKLGANDKTIDKRKLELDKFLTMIATERPKAKRRVRPKYVYSGIELLSLIAPGNAKRFYVVENYINGTYQDTSAHLSWRSSGMGVFAFNAQGKHISAAWRDSQTLEIEHDSTIIFVQKKESFYDSGDQGLIFYKPIER